MFVRLVPACLAGLDVENRYRGGEKLKEVCDASRTLRDNDGASCERDALLPTGEKRVLDESLPHVLERRFAIAEVRQMMLGIAEMRVVSAKRRQSHRHIANSRTIKIK